MGNSVLTGLLGKTLSNKDRIGYMQMQVMWLKQEKYCVIKDEK